MGSREKIVETGLEFAMATQVDPWQARGENKSVNRSA
jgi:hypothetical protein